MAKKYITEEELAQAIDRIMQEAENQAKYNGVEFIGLTQEEIFEKVADKLGKDWVVGSSV